MLMRAILAVSPSTIVKLSATRLRSCGVTVTCTLAAYLPRVMYWRFSSCSARSSAERSKMRASAMPISLQRLLDASRCRIPCCRRTSSELIVGRSCDGDDQDVALRLEAHVAEEAGRVQRLDGLRDLLVVDALADLDRQVREDGAGLGALHALDADVADGERVERPRRRAAHAHSASDAARSTARRRSVRENVACVR